MSTIQPPKVKLPTITCKNCGRTWTPNTPSPKVCTNCKRPWWFKGRGLGWRKGLKENR